MNVNLRPVMDTLSGIQKAQPELEKLKKATDGFESIFLKKMFSQMRSMVTETTFGQTYGKDIFNDMLDESLANAASKSKTLGMGDMLYNQFAPRVVQSFIPRGSGNVSFPPKPSLLPDTQSTISNPFEQPAQESIKS